MASNTTQTRMTRFFAKPYGGAEYQELDMLSISSSGSPSEIPRGFSVEMGREHRKYFRRAMKMMALMQLGMVLPSGKRILLTGYINSVEVEAFNSDRLHVHIELTKNAEFLDA